MTAEVFPRFSTVELERRYAAVRGLMRNAGVEALAVSGRGGSGDVFYLTNYRPWSAAWVIVPARGVPVLLHHFHNHADCIRAQTVVRDVRWYGPSAAAGVAGCLRGLDRGRGAVGLVGLADAISQGQFAALAAELPEVRFTDLDGAFRRLRRIRSEEEIDWLRRSAAMGDRACERLQAGIRPGVDERGLSLLVQAAALAEGGRVALDFLASTPMDAPRRRVPWQYPTPRVLGTGDVVITELSIDNWTYAAQIHRPFAVGRRPPPLYQALFEAAAEAYERVLGVLRPGATSAEAVAAAGVIERRGFTTCDSLLHGEAGKGPELGSPSAVHPLEPLTFEENMVLVIQPNPVTADGRAGLQLGGTVVVRAQGAEALAAYPLAFPVCAG